MSESQTSKEDQSAKAAILLDRFASASSADAALESLQGLLDGYKNSSQKWETEWILNDSELVGHLIILAQTGSTHKDIACEEGQPQAIQLFLQLAKDKQCLTVPTPGRLLEAMLDVMGDASSTTSDYVRVLALQLLKELSTLRQAESQWLQAPNGLHRLGDLLDQGASEVVRNEALLVARILSRHAAIAKVWLFAEVEVKLLDLCWAEGGLTKGNPIVLDALSLTEELVKHADSSLQDLVWQRPTLAPSLARLLDLRGGTQFLNPKEIPTSAKSGKGDDDDDDDLDNLLSSGAKDQPKTDGPIPKLTEKEEDVIRSVLGILRWLLDSEKLRPSILKQHPGLFSLIWQLALLYPSSPAVCAIPSASLQQVALEFVAIYLNDSELMEQHNGLDNLLMLVCTGGGTAQTLREKLGISQAALHVLRNTLTGDRIHQVLLHTIAPPVDQDEDVPPPGPTVIQKLWNTVAENMTPHEEGDDSVQRKIFLSGALGGLSMMLPDTSSREMMLKVTPSQANMDGILGTLQEEPDKDIQMMFLRFLAEWMNETPLVVQKLLSANDSTFLASLASSKGTIGSLANLVFGLAMEYMEDETKCGGWTRSGILKVIQKSGISKFTTSLESLKDDRNVPWSVCELEFKNWSAWLAKSIWTVRKRVVEELTGGSEGHGSDDEGLEVTGDQSTSSASTKSLQKLVAQQANELDSLREDLASAQARVSSQQQQLDIWKKRMESNPTELDAMLSDFTLKNSILEERVKILEKEIEQSNLDHEAKMKDKERKLSDQREEVEQLRGQHQEARDDRDRMEQELQALSQAYSSLEQEYQSSQAASGVMPGTAGAPTSEEREQRQPQGEVSQQAPAGAGSTELSTLRSENQRLQTDARAADEWMSMAVQRMNEMGSTNTSLQQEVASLQAQIQTLSSTTENSAKIADERLEVAARKEEELRHEVNRVTKENSELLAKLTVQGSMQEGPEEIARLSAALDESRATIQELNAQIDNETNDDAHLREISELSSQLSEQKVAYEELKKNSEETIYQKESRVRELEEIINSHGGEITVDDIHSKDKLIDELQGANQAAQDWMKKAVEHHQQLSSQVASLADEKNALSIKLQEALEKQDLSATRVDSDLAIVEQERKAHIEQVASLNARIEEFEARVSSLTSELSQKKESLEELSSLTDEISLLREQLEKAQAESAEMASLKAEVASLKSQADHPNAVDVLTDENQRLSGSLDEYQKWAETVQQRIGEMMSEKEKTDKVLHELQDELDSVKRSSQEEIQAWKDRVLSLESSDKSALARISSQESSGTRDSEAEADLERKLDSLEDELKSEMKSLESRVEHSAGTAESIQVDMDKKLQEKTMELEAAQDTIRNKDSELESLRSTIIDNESRLVASQGIVASREAEIESIRSQLKEQEDAVSIMKRQMESLQESSAILERQLEKTTAKLEEAREWESKYQDSAARCSGLEKEISELHVEVKSLTKALRVAEANNAQLEHIKGTPQAELEKVAHNLKQGEESQNEAAAFFGSNPPSSVPSANETNDFFSSVSQAPTGVDNSKVEAKEFFSSTSTEEVGEDETSALRSKLAAKEEELRSTHENLVTEQRKVQSATDRAAELEASVQRLTVQLEEAQKEAEIAVGGWQEQLEAAEAKYNDLDREFQALRPSPEIEHTEHITSNTHAVPTKSSLNNMEALQEKLRMKEEELRLANESLAQDEDVVQQWSDRVQELEGTVQDLEKQLNDQAKEAETVIAGWQENYTEAEKKSEQLDSERNDLQKSLDSLSAELEELRKSATQSKTDPAVEIQELTSKLVERESELRAAQETLERDENVVQQWSDRATELETTVKDLEAQLDEQAKEAENAISSWQQNFSELESRCEQLEQECISLRGDTQAVAEENPESTTVFSTQEGLPITDELRSQLREKEQELRLAQETLAQDENIVQQWSDRVVELEAIVEDLESQLVEQGREAEAAIAGWQEDYMRLEAEHDALVSSAKSLPKQLEGSVTPSLLTTDDVSHETERAKIELISLRERLSEKEEELRVAQASLAQVNDAVETWKDRVAELESDLETLEKQLQEQHATSERNISDLGKECTELKSKCSSLQLEVDELTSTSASLQAKLKEQTEETNDAIMNYFQLEDKCATLENDVAKLASENSLQREQCVALDEKLSIVEAEAAQSLDKAESFAKSQAERDEMFSALLAEARQKDDTIASLEDNIASLLSELNSIKSSMQSAGAIEDRESDFSTSLKQVNEELGVAKSEIEGLQTALDESRAEILDVAAQWKERAETLEGVIKRQETQIEEHTDEANAVIEAWEAKTVELEAELDAVNEELTAMKSKICSGSGEDSWETALELLFEERERAMKDRGSLQARIDGQSEDFEHWKSQVGEMERQLQAQRLEIESLELQRDEIVGSRDAVQQELQDVHSRYEKIAQEESEMLLATNASMKESLEEMSSKLSAAESLRIELEREVEKKQYLEEERANLSSRITELQADLNNITALLENTKISNERAENEHRLVLLREREAREKAEDEVDRLSTTVTQLEDDLNEANDMLQTYVTDEVASRASQVVVQDLKIDIEAKKAKLAEFEHLFQRERAAREVAELEVERLKSDLGTLLSTKSDEDPSIEAHLLSARASELAKKKNRDEVEKLRSALFRAMDELEAARLSERETKEALSKTRLQLSVCQQDLITAKSELNFVTESMEEMRQAEESRRASLEYRISSLENNAEVMRRYHSGELESLQNEVSQITMEKDRILQTLRESESTNSKLVLAASTKGMISEEDKQDPADTEHLLSSYRIENAHLLTLSSDENAKSERRLREALAAQAAAVEAQVILEQELRQKAEDEVRAVKTELDELRQDAESTIYESRGSKRKMSSEDVDSLQSDIERLNAELKKVTSENDALKAKLNDASASAKVEIERLTNECRTAQAKSLKLERESQLSSAVRSEVSTLRSPAPVKTYDMNPHSKDHDWAMVGHNFNVEDAETAFANSDAYELIQKQQEAITEERNCFRDLLQEHDELLALLAQHEKERECLREALVEAAGEESAETAMQRAQELAMTQFGKAVKLST